MHDNNYWKKTDLKKKFYKNTLKGRALQITIRINYFFFCFCFFFPQRLDLV